VNTGHLTRLVSDKWLILSHELCIKRVGLQEVVLII
jgi:hypothetical protein